MQKNVPSDWILNEVIGKKEDMNTHLLYVCATWILKVISFVVLNIWTKTLNSITLSMDVHMRPALTCKPAHVQHFQQRHEYLKSIFQYIENSQYRVDMFTAWKIHGHQFSEGVCGGLFQDDQHVTESHVFLSKSEYIIALAPPLYCVVNLCFHARHFEIKTMALLLWRNAVISLFSIVRKYIKATVGIFVMSNCSHFTR